MTEVGGRCQLVASLSDRVNMRLDCCRYGVAQRRRHGSGCVCSADGRNRSHTHQDLVFFMCGTLSPTSRTTSATVNAGVVPSG